MPSRLPPLWHYGSSCTWAHDVRLHIVGLALWSHQSAQTPSSERCIMQIVNVSLRDSPPNPQECSTEYIWSVYIYIYTTTTGKELATSKPVSSFLILPVHPFPVFVLQFEGPVLVTVALATRVNAKILNETRNANSDGCNCRKRNSCPLDGACQASGIVYKATVTTNIGQPNIYIGSTEHSFKTRFNNHKISLKYRKHSHSTCLSKYI